MAKNTVTIMTENHLDIGMDAPEKYLFMHYGSKKQLQSGLAKMIKSYKLQRVSFIYGLEGFITYVQGGNIVRKLWADFNKKHKPVKQFREKLFGISKNKVYKHYVFDLKTIKPKEIADLIFYFCVEDVRLYGENNKISFLFCVNERYIVQRVKK